MYVYWQFVAPMNTALGNLTQSSKFSGFRENLFQFRMLYFTIKNFAQPHHWILSGQAREK